MRLLQNFTIRMVMLTILGLFCLLWSGVGLYSVHALSEVSEGNDIDRHLVRQMTVLSQGNDQYFRFVTRLSRAMDVKIGGGTPDFAPARQSLENMRQKLEEMKALSPGPMNPDISREVLSNWQALLEKGVVPQMQLAQQGSLTAWSEHASTVTPALSRAFGASAERFSHEAGAMLDNTRVMVDGKTYTIRILLITAVILGIAILIFTDRYLVAMMVKPLERIRQQFQRIAQGDLSQPIEALGRNCVGRRYCARCRTVYAKPSVRSAPEATISGAARRKFLPVITISLPERKNRPPRWKKLPPAWNSLPQR